MRLWSPAWSCELPSRPKLPPLRPLVYVDVLRQELGRTQLWLGWVQVGARNDIVAQHSAIGTQAQQPSDAHR
eukprot:COSAG04_NODE_23309_length_340_cov_1.265560_1_plen_71_part_01